VEHLVVTEINDAAVVVVVIVFRHLVRVEQWLLPLIEKSSLGREAAGNGVVNTRDWQPPPMPRNDCNTAVDHNRINHTTARRSRMAIDDAVSWRVPWSDHRCRGLFIIKNIVSINGALAENQAHRRVGTSRAITLHFGAVLFQGEMKSLVASARTFFV
jgi:hypothetical protein